MNASKEWTKEEVESFIKNEDLRYQRIDLPFNLSTNGDDRRPTAKLIFPDDMQGKTVLDIGCKFGFFCFEALKKGAQDAMGIDIDSECVRRSQTIASMLNLPAKFEHCDVEYKDFERQFDYVLCLNILHHLKDPLHALNSLIKWTKDTLIIEIAGFQGRDRQKFNMSFMQEKLLANLPLVLVSDAKLNANTNQNFFFTFDALKNAIQNRTNSFAKIEKVPTPHKGRDLLVAKKRKIKKLIVISGPTSSGKSTFIDHIMKGKVPQLFEECGITPEQDLTLTTNTKIHLHTEVETQALIYHYDMLKSFHFPNAYFENDPSLDVLREAEEIYIYTLWTEPDRLRKQLYENEIERRDSPRKKHLRVQKMYEDDNNIKYYYRSWIKYLKNHAFEHSICSYENFQFNKLDESLL